jgi:hypothetical protein
MLNNFSPKVIFISQNSPKSNMASSFARGSFGNFEKKQWEQNCDLCDDEEMVFLSIS